MNKNDCTFQFSKFERFRGEENDAFVEYTQGEAAQSISGYPSFITEDFRPDDDAHKKSLNARYSSPNRVGNGARTSSIFVLTQKCC
ncbi:hypothetical protein ASZ90_015755 [hydrocarbon metagenome]|uniref:Uncharacterized protein n=1 Tax=hydrocarbon metagenome TaxID=938273 RepID=A0A0W8F1A7_9ZZZZ